MTSVSYPTGGKQFEVERDRVTPLNRLEINTGGQKFHFAERNSSLNDKQPRDPFSVSPNYVILSFSIYDQTDKIKMNGFMWGGREKGISLYLFHLSHLFFVRFFFFLDKRLNFDTT